MRYFMADTHFHHPSRGARGRGGIIAMMARVNPDTKKLFSCQEEHDEYLIASINSTLNRGDELIIAGDFAFDKPGRYRQQILCKHVKLIRGNHDRLEKSRNVFGTVVDELHTKAYNKSGNDFVKLFITHYPNWFWDGSHAGWAHLYGHTHGMRETYMDSIEPQRRAMDIGVDNIYRLYGNYQPLSEIQIYDYMAVRSGHDDLRFYKDYQMGLYLDRGLIP